MKVLVDTSVWSLALRRQSQQSRPTKSVEAGEAQELRKLISAGNVAIIGPIRQELLSGVREQAQFERLRNKLSAFPDMRIESTDYETAAMFFNRCRAKGIQGSNTDFLICAVSVRKEMQILTNDGDFTFFAKHLPIKMNRFSNAGVLVFR